jgi:hypothetical protein
MKLPARDFCRTCGESAIDARELATSTVSTTYTLAAMSLALGHSSNKSLLELDEGSWASPFKSQEDKPRAGLRDKSYKPSLISLEDNVTTSGSAGRIEHHGSEASAGSDVKSVQVK